ncbi:MAG TPA: SPFH domain-containing protein [Candidatus Dormibacteraeota bacterium]|jgi:membrane protease subunit (stomatin/prohibitin family)|nr:SPFH domain-containing protein [Candidatus Dormibacteraeota bacterium]
MALFKRENIAVPDDKKDQLVYKWPDQQIRRFTKAIVAPDETAVFLYQGQVIGTLPPGRHTVDAVELPFLGVFKDMLTAGNAYRTELYFVSNRQVMDRFGGQVDEVQDPQTGLLVTLRVFGEYIVHVKDGTALITKFSGTQDVPDNSRITALTEDMLLRGLRTDLTKNIVRNSWPVLGLAAYTDEMETAAVAAGNANLGDYGLEIIRMANFTVSLDEDTEAELRRLAKDTAYSRLAGSFQQYAAGEAALGAGEGMAKGGGGTGGAFLAAGLGIGGQAAQPMPPGPPPPPAPGFAGGGGGYTQPGGGDGGGSAAVTCPNCQASNPATAKFCSACGTSLTPKPAICPSCGAELGAGAKFCPSCGKSVAEPAAAEGAPPLATPPAKEG